MNKKWPTDEELARLLNRKASESESWAWGSNEDYKDLNQIVQLTDQLEVPAAKSQEQAWAELQAKIETEEQKRSGKLIAFAPQVRRYAWLAVAAAAVLICLVWAPWQQTEPVYETYAAQQQHRVVELPDGSQAVLNSNSELKYDAQNWEKERRVYLEGEGYFDVVEGGHFTVDGPNVDAQVLGTRFNVYDRPGTSEVKVFEGRVRTTFEAEDYEKVLVEGEYLKKSSTSSVEVRKFETTSQPGWMAGRFHYEEPVPLAEAWGELERQYGLELVVSPGVEVQGETFRGTFFGPNYGDRGRDENLEKALRTLLTFKRFHYEKREPNVIVITAP